MQAPSRMFFGPLTALGLTAAAIAGVLDQASKLWLLKLFGLADKGVVKVMPFVDLVLTWNTGISYGWFQTDSALGQVVLLGFKVIAVIVLSIWMVRSQTRLATTALGLIIGGAIVTVSLAPRSKTLISHSFDAWSRMQATAAVASPIAVTGPQR